MQPVQIKMARAALGLSVDDLAAQAGVPAEALDRLEAGGSAAPDLTRSLNLFLASHGIELIDDDGVRAKTSDARDYVPVDQLTTDNDGGQG